jgi:ABC-type uncharacterized transport system permease subunit
MQLFRAFLLRYRAIALVLAIALMAVETPSGLVMVKLGESMAKSAWKGNSVNADSMVRR